MKVTSIMPCIRVTKENYMVGFNMHIEEGEIIEVIDEVGNRFNGAFMCLELIEEGEEGVLYLLQDNDEEAAINTWDIKDIVEQNNNN